MVSDSDGIGSASNARSVETPSCAQSTCSIAGDYKVPYGGTMRFNYLFDPVRMSWLINVSVNKPRHAHRIKRWMQWGEREK